MAYNGAYEPQGRPYAGPAAARPAPQRQYPPGPGRPPQQQYNAPPPQQQQQQQYDQYQDEYGYGYDEYGNGYDEGYGGQYDDMNYGRGGPPPNQNYPPQDYPGPGPGRGGPGMSPGRGGPRGGGSGRGPGPGPGPGRGYPPQGRGGRPGPLERAGNSDPTGKYCKNLRVSIDTHPLRCTRLNLLASIPTASYEWPGKPE